MSKTGTTMGRRERKKAATTKAIADAALQLFLRLGYDQVSVKDIADEADVSTTTLFKHFPGKEALVFDEDVDLEAALLDAVRERPVGQSIPAALREHTLRGRITQLDDPEFRQFRNLVESTPPLRDYHRRLGMRYERSLAQTIAADQQKPADDPTCAALAHFALDAKNLADSSANPELAVQTAFDLLENGWNTITSSG
jgi:AcrR family transcriptional regulator